MPACVLYSSEDMEPITIIDAPMWAMKRLQECKRVVFPIKPSIPKSYIEDPPTLGFIEYVSVYAEKYYRHGKAGIFLFTDNDTLALRLKSTLLPGQRKAQQDLYREAFMEGFLTSLIQAR